MYDSNYQFQNFFKIAQPFKHMYKGEFIVFMILVTIQFSMQFSSLNMQRSTRLTLSWEETEKANGH